MVVLEVMQQLVVAVVEINHHLQSDEISFVNDLNDQSVVEINHHHRSDEISFVDDLNV